MAMLDTTGTDLPQRQTAISPYQQPWTTNAMATGGGRKFRGVDPNSSRTGLQAWDDLQGLTGPLNDTQKQEAIRFLGYTDPTGQAAIGGGAYNSLLQEAAKLFGGEYEDWTNPGQTDPFSPAPPGTTPPGGDPGGWIPIDEGGVGYPVPGGDPGGWIPIDEGGVGYPVPGGGMPGGGTPAPGGPGGPGGTLPPAPGGTQSPASRGITLPDPFQYDPFKARSFDEIVAGQAFQGRLKQGLGAINAQGAAGGDLFSPNTVKGLIDYAQNSASAEYDKELARDLDTYKTNYGVGTDVYDRSVDASVLRRQAEVDDRAYDFGREVYEDERGFRNRSFEDATAFRNKEYETGEKRWQAEFNQRKTEYMQDRDFQQAVYANDDAYKRYRDTVDDQWKLFVLEEQRRQFLAGLGAR